MDLPSSAPLLAPRIIMRFVFVHGLVALFVLGSASSQAMAADRTEAHEAVAS